MRTRTVDGRIADIWGARTPFAPGEEWTVRVDTLLEPGVDEKQVSWVPSACVLCSNGCGLDIARARRPHRRCARPRERPGQSRPIGSKGTPRLAGKQRPG